LIFYFHIKLKKKFTIKGKKHKEITKANKELKKIDDEEKIKLCKFTGLISTQLNRHTLLIGTNGSGKTTTALITIKQLVNKFNQPVIIIDGKGDSDLIDKIKQEDPKALV
jgi:type IV secretory pathway VirB4 component